MTDLASSTLSIPDLRRIGWRRTALRSASAVAILVVLALWLWALPALLARQGFVLRGDEACAQASWRDPVTGRSMPAPAHACVTVPTGPRR